MAKATAELTTESIQNKLIPALDRIWEAVSKENPNAEKIAALDASLKQFEKDPAFASIIESLNATATQLQDQGLATAREKFAVALIAWGNDKKIPLALKSGGTTVGNGRKAAGGGGTRVHLTDKQKEIKTAEAKTLLQAGEIGKKDIMAKLGLSSAHVTDMLKTLKAKPVGPPIRRKYTL